jgi:hypothetical protein
LVHVYIVSSLCKAVVSSQVAKCHNLFNSFPVVFWSFLVVLLPLLIMSQEHLCSYLDKSIYPLGGSHMLAAGLKDMHVLHIARNDQIVT